jgi:hypothetical protein
LLAIAIGCASSRAPTRVSAELGQTHAAPVVSSRYPARVRHHMREHLRDLQSAQRALLAGNLDEARAYAFVLAARERVTRDVGMPAWSADATRVGEAADRLASATTMAEATELLPRVAYACGVCHRRAGARPNLALPPREPPLPCHEWAGARMLESIVVDSASRWTAAWSAIASRPGPLATPARAALAAPPVPEQQRSAVYARVLATCVGCHASR